MAAVTGAGAVAGGLAALAEALRKRPGTQVPHRRQLFEEPLASRLQFGERAWQGHVSLQSICQNITLTENAADRTCAFTLTHSKHISDVHPQREAALSAALEAQRRVPEDRFLLDHAIKLASRAAHFEEAKVLCATWRRLGGNADHPLEQEIQSLVEAVAAGAFTEEGVRSVFAILGAVQAAERVHSARYVVLPDLEQPSAFLYEHYLHATSERAALVNERFVERVVARPELMDDPGLNFVVMPIGTG